MSNSDESISRKDAKAQRRHQESFQDKLSFNSFASFPCVFAPLREPAFLSLST
jgi:hypothetical protein